MDGQHRLMAIVKTGHPLRLTISSNLEDDVFDVLDTGKSRNATDCFYIAGIKFSNIIPSIISHYNMLEEGRKRGMQLNQKATNAALLDQYYKDEIFWQNIAHKSINWYNNFAKILPPSFIGGTYAHLNKLNPDKSEIFMNQLCTGLDVSNSVINLLRNKLIQDKTSTKKMQPTFKVALTIKAWNQFVAGGNIKLLRFNAVQEEYPYAVSGIAKKGRLAVN